MMHTKLLCCGILPAALIVGAMAYFTSAGAKDSATKNASASVGACSCCVECSNPDCACELLDCRCDQGEACKCSAVTSTVSAKSPACACCVDCTCAECKCDELGCQCDEGGPCVCDITCGSSCCSSACKSDKSAGEAAKPCCSGAGCSAGSCSK
jgi:hypothetical protein